MKRIKSLLVVLAVVFLSNSAWSFSLSEFLNNVDDAMTEPFKVFMLNESTDWKPDGGAIYVSQGRVLLKLDFSQDNIDFYKRTFCGSRIPFALEFDIVDHDSTLGDPEVGNVIWTTFPMEAIVFRDVGAFDNYPTLAAIVQRPDKLSAGTYFIEFRLKQPFSRTGDIHLNIQVALDLLRLPIVLECLPGSQDVNKNGWFYAALETESFQTFSTTLSGDAYIWWESNLTSHLVYTNTLVQGDLDYTCSFDFGSTPDPELEDGASIVASIENFTSFLGGKDDVTQPPNPEVEPDLHIRYVRGGLASEDRDDMNNSVTEAMWHGQCLRLSFIAQYRNEADQEARDVDFDWRADQKDQRFNEEDDKLCDENREDVDAGETNTKTFNNASLCVSGDSATLTLTGPDGSISSPFEWDADRQGFVARLYVFADVEEKGREDGDHDISSPNKRDEYVEIEIILIPKPPQASFSASATQVVAPATVSFTNASAGDDLQIYYWNFGDGETSIEQNPSHKYTTAGDYAVTLTVTSPTGSDTASQVIHVDPEPPYVRVPEPKSGVEWKSNKDRWVKIYAYHLPVGYPVRVQYSCDYGAHWLTCHEGDIRLGYDATYGYLTRFKWKMDKRGTKDMSNSRALVRVLDRNTGQELGRSALFRTNRASGDPKWPW